MTDKQLVLQAVKKLPETATIEEAMEILFIAKVEKGIAQADVGKTISHSAIKKRMKKWLK
jgi:hypothetical protein